MSNQHLLSDAPAHAVGFETRDVNIRGVLGLAAVVIVTVVVVGVVLWWMWTRFEMEMLQSESKPLFPRAETPSASAPRLQETPIRDYAEYRQQQDKAAGSYEWIDREVGTVRIPVERAMELYLQRGAPASWPAEKKNEETPP